MNWENNKKWSPVLTGTFGFLWGIIALCGVLAYNYISTSPAVPIAFVTQQFLTSTPFNNPVNPWNPNVANPNVANPINPNPVNPQVFGKWNFLFAMVMNNPNPPVLPTCKVKGWVIVSVQPGQIHFEAQPDPANARIRCGLMDMSTNLLIDLAPVNVISSDFMNIPEGKYDVVCLVRKPGIINIMNSFNFCSDGTFPIDSTWAVNPPVNPTASGAVIDLELYGYNSTVTANTGSNPIQPSQLSYQFKIHNNPNNASGSVSGAQLRIYPQNVTNIVISGSTQSGTMYLVDLWLLNPGDGIGVTMDWMVDPAGSGAVSVAAELCNYANDVDSQACNMVNLTPTQDDEVKL